MAYLRHKGCGGRFIFEVAPGPIVRVDGVDASVLLTGECSHCCTRVDCYAAGPIMAEDESDEDKIEEIEDD